MTVKPAPRRAGKRSPGRRGEPAPVRGGPRLRARGRALAEAAARFGYTRWALASLVRDYRAGKLELFAPPRRPGRNRARRRRTRPRPGHRAAPPGPVGLRDFHPADRRGHPAEPHRGRGDPGRGGLRPAAAPPRARGQHQPGHARAGTRTCPPPRSSTSPPGPPRVDTTPGRAAAGHPRPGRPGPARPGSPRPATPAPASIPAVSWLLSLLALKLTRTRRVSHVDDLLADPAAALFAGLAILPKKSALTELLLPALPRPPAAASWPPWTPR